MFELLLLIYLLIAFTASVRGGVEGWTYASGTAPTCDGSNSGTGLCGPEFWGNLVGAESCGEDSRQSPMNLAQAVISNQVPDMHFDFESGCSNWTQGANDHNFNIKFAPFCYNLTIKILDELFYLDSIHFHSPSEHTIGGGFFAAEAHLLHYSFTTDAIVYVSILLDQSSDRLPFTNNSFLDSLWNSRHVSEIASETSIQHSRAINPYEDLFPGTYSHFNYLGSLTTPPCTPGAKWFIFDSPVPISADDVSIIRATMATVPDSKRSQQGNTNRPVQPKNGRPLYYSYGINSKSDIDVLDSFSSCDNDDILLAKRLSVVAIGISGICICLMVVGFACWHRTSINTSIAKSQDNSFETSSAEPRVLAVAPGISNNPMFENRPPSKDSIL